PASGTSGTMRSCSNSQQKVMSSPSSPTAAPSSREPTTSPRRGRFTRSLWEPDETCPVAGRCWFIHEDGVMGSTVLLAALAVLAACGSGSPPLPEVQSRFPLLSDEECWRNLPPAEKGGGRSLPSWARALAGLLPRTTAAMLQLDFVHRTQNP